MLIKTLFIVTSLLLPIFTMSDHLHWKKLTDQINNEDKTMFTVVLKLSNKDQMYEEMQEITNPNSPRYADYLTKTEVDHIVRPNHDVTGLMSFLGKQYCEDLVLAIKCNMPIGRASELFGTKFTKYSKGNHIRYIGDKYTIPAFFHDDVHFILGLIDFPETDTIIPKISNDIHHHNYKYISRESLFSMYNITDEQQNESSTQAVIEYLNDACFNMDDYNLFQKQNGMTVNSNITFYGNACDTGTLGPDLEAALDIQFQCATGNCDAQQYVNSDGWLYSAFILMYRLTNPPLVTSSSYGWWEGDQQDIQSLPSEEYVDLCNFMLLLLGIRGVSNTVSSGDAGPFGRTNEGCSLVPHLRPDFPGSSPYVISVGGTKFYNATSGGNTPFCQKHQCVMKSKETDVTFKNSQWCSGGGIANFSVRQYWSLDQNNHYLRNITADYLPDPSEYNPFGRQYPDVTMDADHYAVAYTGKFTSVDGTSCSSPAFSGLIARLNSVRMNNGCPPLGLFNPLLYQMSVECPECFVSKRKGCIDSTEAMTCSPDVKGYCSTEGYNVVYGLGLPNYGYMSAYIKQNCLDMKQKKQFKNFFA